MKAAKLLEPAPCPACGKPPLRSLDGNRQFGFFRCDCVGLRAGFVNLARLGRPIEECQKNPDLWHNAAVKGWNEDPRLKKAAEQRARGVR